MNYHLGDIKKEEFCGYGVINEMANYIDSYLHDEEIETYNVSDFSRNLSKFLFEVLNSRTFDFSHVVRNL